MWRQRTGSRRRLQFEQFESRRLMAVNTLVNGGVLSIAGDAGADDIAIVGTGNPGEMTITGRSNTTVNGVPNGSVTVSGVTGDLIVALGDGNNVLNIDNVYIARSIYIDTGSGNDTVTLGASNPVSPALDLSIVTGAGNDTVNEDTTIYNVFVGRDNAVITGDGHDNVTLFGASAARDIVIDGGDGGDELEARGVTAAGTLVVRGGTRGSFIDGLAIVTTSALRGIVADLVAGGNIYIDTVYTAGTMRVGSQFPFGMNSDGNLVLDVHRSILGQLIVTGNGGTVAAGESGSQGGNDQIRITTNQIGYQSTGYTGAAMEMNTGAGADNIQVDSNLVTTLNVALGESDDRMTLIGNRLDQSASIDGGDGSDSLIASNNQFASQTVVSFP